MEPKGNGEVGKPVSGATPLSKREGGFFGVLTRGEFRNHLRSRRADSTSAGARLVNTLFGEVNKKTLIDAPEPSPTPKTEFTELSLNPPKDRLNRELRPDFDKVYPNMSKWLIQRLKTIVEIQKTNRQMCEKGGVFANDWLLAQAMLGDAGTISEVKVKEYFKDPQAYATTMTMIEDSLATLAFSQGKYIQRNQTDGITVNGHQILARDTRREINPDATTTPLGERVRGALPALVRMVVAGGAGAAFAGTPVINRIATALGSAISAAAANPGSAVESAVSGALVVAAAGAAIGSGGEGLAQLNNQDGGNHIRKLQDALTAVRDTPGAAEAVKAMYGIDPANIRFNGDVIEFIDGNTNSPAWDAAQKQLRDLSRMRQDYYRHVHRLDPCQVDGMPEQYLADDPAGNTDLRIEQTGSKAQAEIMLRFNKKLEDRLPPGIIGCSAAERLRLMTEARREWLGVRLSEQFDKSSLKKDAAQRARQKILISTQIEMLKKGDTDDKDGEKRKKAKAEAKKSVKLHENLLTLEGIKAEPESLVGYLKPVEALKLKRRELQPFVSKYGAHLTNPPTSAQCRELVQKIRGHLEGPGASTLDSSKDSLLKIRQDAESKANEIAKTDKEKADSLKDNFKVRRLTEIEGVLARSLADIKARYDADRAQFDRDIAELSTAADSMDKELTNLSELGKDAQAIKSVVEKLNVRRVGADRLGIPTARLILFGTPGNSFQVLMEATNQTQIPIADRDKPEYQKELIRAIADAKAEAAVNTAIGRDAAAPTRREQVYDLAMTHLGYELLGMTDQQALDKGTWAPLLTYTAAVGTTAQSSALDNTAITLTEIAACRRAMEGVLQARSKAYKETLAIVEYQKKQAEANVLNVDTDCDAKEKAYEIIRNRFLEADRGKAAYEMATKMVRDFATMFEARAFPAPGDPDTKKFLAGELVGFPERSITNLLEAIFKYKDAPENSTIKDPNVSFSAVNEALGGAEMQRTLVMIFVDELHLDTLPPLPAPPPAPVVPTIDRLGSTYREMMDKLRAANGITPFTVPQMQKVVSGIINHVCEAATFGNI